MRSQAVRFHGPGDLRRESVELDDPRDGEVLVRVMACGVCGSDLHFVGGSAHPRRVPITLGHEVAGSVVTSRSPTVVPGQEVISKAGIVCGRCRACTNDRPMLCERLRLLGIDFDGGLAEFMLVPAGALITKPPNLSWSVAATAPDAGATACHAASCRGKIQPGSTVAVIGVGGLGGYAAQIAKLLGAAPVIAIDTNPLAVEAAQAAGADEGIVAEEGVSVGRQVKLLTDGGADVALEFVGKPETVDTAVKSIRPGGRAVVAGVGPEPLRTLPPVLWSNHEYELVGSFGSHEYDLTQVLAWLSSGKLHAPRLQEVSLEDAIPAMLAAAAGSEPHGRLIVTP